MKKSIKRFLGVFATCGLALALVGCKGKKKTTTGTKVVTPTKEGYNILWADEFNDSTLNKDIWLREIRQAGWTNNELQRYTDNENNGFVRDGKFVIKGIEHEDGSYSSCKLRNTSAASFKYGRIEASAKVPAGKGLWPAIWMMPEDEGLYGQWPKCGEIDIMEVLGDNVEKAYGTLHWGEPHAEKQGTVTLDDGSFASDFHEYAIEWEPGKIEWFIDGQSYLVANDWFTAVDGGEEKPYPAPFNQNFCVQINLAIGGDWPGNPEPNAEYMKDAEFEIDYVRVYQKDSYDENVKKPEKDFRKPDETGNYISDATFEKPFVSDYQTEVGWLTYTSDGGNANFTQVEGGGIKIEVTKAGSKDYSVQLFHSIMPFEKDKTYKISFDYWADSDLRVNEICIDAPNANWTRYWSTGLKFTTEHKTLVDYFTMTRKDDNMARFEFNLGNTFGVTTFYINNVRVEEVEPCTITLNNIDNVTANISILANGNPVVINPSKPCEKGAELFIQILNDNEYDVEATLTIGTGEPQEIKIDAKVGDEPGANGFMGVELTDNMTLTIKKIELE